MAHELWSIVMNYKHNMRVCLVIVHDGDNRIIIRFERLRWRQRWWLMFREERDLVSSWYRQCKSDKGE